MKIKKLIIVFCHLNFKRGNDSSLLSYTTTPLLPSYPCSKNNYSNVIEIRFHFRRFLIFLIFLRCSSTQSSSDHQQGTLTNTYGRISNIANEHIYVSASLSVTNCVHQCAEFSSNHHEYVSEDCFAYNYDLRSLTCELIHSVEPLEYTVSFQTQWMTGLKYPSSL